MKIDKINLHLTCSITVNIDRCPEKYSFQILPHFCERQNQVLVVVITSGGPSSTCRCDYSQHKKSQTDTRKTYKIEDEKTCFSWLILKTTEHFCNFCVFTVIIIIQCIHEYFTPWITLSLKSAHEKRIRIYGCIMSRMI